MLTESWAIVGKLGERVEHAADGSIQTARKSKVRGNKDEG